MPASALSDFRDVIRVLIGDDDPQGLTEYEDGQIDQAVKMVFQLGFSPAGYSVDYGSGTIEPAIVEGDHFALIAFKAARLRLGGEEGGSTYRTRALSVTSKGDSKRDILLELERMVHQIEGGVCCFVTQRDFVTWFNDMNGGLLQKNLRWDGRSGGIYDVKHG